MTLAIVFVDYWFKKKTKNIINKRNGLRDGKGAWKRGPGNADSYEGEYVNDKKCGYGVFTWASGNVYKGNYFEDLRHGYGEMTWTDGSYYKGAWEVSHFWTIL